MCGITNTEVRALQLVAVSWGWNGFGLILERLSGFGAKNPRSEA